MHIHVITPTVKLQYAVKINRNAKGSVLALKMQTPSLHTAWSETDACWRRAQPATARGACRFLSLPSNEHPTPKYHPASPYVPKAKNVR
ncbi:hypothetical protein EVAR_3981_1 [Eumeta japonica]|uniref:Uncharacterized protein n=1 Tax=Eumeta variegata TaxID=151549 RepID=A0A4C1SRP4_EUMVA|nr:hypothetical protein EVAR_3981_1 [Eumeta japonica]